MFGARTLSFGKPISMNRLIINSILVATMSVAFMACDAAGPKRIDTAAASMSDTKSMLARGGAEVTAALTAAEAVGLSPDLKASYASFTKSLETLQKTADQVRDRWESLTTKAQSYTDSWQKEAEQLTSETARTAAASRREEFTNRMSAIRSSMGEVKTSYDGFVADMSDIRVLLANDLTVDGIKSVKSLLVKAKKDADTLQTKATAATRLLEEVIASSATTLPTPPAAAAAPAAK